MDIIGMTSQLDFVRSSNIDILDLASQVDILDVASQNK